MLYEQPRGVDKASSELVFNDDSITYKANSNIQRIEIATNYQLKMVINDTPEMTFIFNVPASDRC